MPLWKDRDHTFCKGEGCPKKKECTRYVGNYKIMNFANLSLAEFTPEGCQFFVKI